MVRARLAFQVNGQHVYSGIVHTVTSIVRTVRSHQPCGFAARPPAWLLVPTGGSPVSFQEGGVRALYKGLAPTVLGMVPYAGEARILYLPVTGNLRMIRHKILQHTRIVYEKWLLVITSELFRAHSEKKK